MCEGKFLVRTRVIDNVIHQVTVENFRFGVRVIKKSEGCWSCHDLNQSKTNNNYSSNNIILQSQEADKSGDGILIDNNSKEKNNNWTSLLDSRNLLSSQCTTKREQSIIVSNCPSSKTTTNNKTDFVRVDKEEQNIDATDNNTKRSPAVVVNISCNLNNNNKNKNISKVKYPQSTSETIITSEFPSSLNGFYNNNIFGQPKSISRSVRKKETIRASGTEKRQEQIHLKYPGTVGTDSNRRIPTKKTKEFNSQYLSKYLGKSPLLKLQLLNLLVVPVDGQQRCPELIPMETISSLRSMLFDDDGSERSGSGSGSIHENIRPRDSDDDRLDTKRVKIEMEEDDLVIDENAVDGEDIMSEENSSIESNLENLEGTSAVDILDNNGQNITRTSTTTMTTTTTSTSLTTNSNSKGVGPASIHKRSNSSSSVASSHGKSSNSSSMTALNVPTKNGHDARRVSKVNQQNRKCSTTNNNSVYNEDCNNTTPQSSKVEKNISSTSTSAAGMVLRLEKEIMSLASLLKVKEREWNAIIRLKKLKELALDIFRRQQEVEQLDHAESLQNSEDFASLLTKINSETELGSDEAQTRLNAEKTEKEIKEEEKKLKNYRIHDESSTTSTAITTTTLNKKDTTSKDSSKQNNNNNDSSLSSVENFKASLALQQLCERNRSSLGCSPSTTPVQNNTSFSGGIQNKVIGEGRQGNIVEVRSIIADYRSKNPEDVVHSPSQDKKKTSRRGTSSSTTSNNVHANSIMQQNVNISFKDILVGLAQVSQNDKMGASISSPQEIVTMNARGVLKSNNATMLQTTAFTSSRGQLNTTLAKLLSSDSSVSIPGGIAHSSDETSSITPLKSDHSGNHMTNDSSSLSLASLLASSKGREDDIKADEEDHAPVCQGCNLNRAQFVCAGCGNQWYCSRECQIGAWDDHSELCSG